jgi:NMD protein affecting ribosome stability and mRNA decay
MSGGHRRITCVHCGGVGIHHGHGLCHTCYAYRRRTGRTRPLVHPTTCVVCGRTLGAPRHGRICRRCYQRAWRLGLRAADIYAGRPGVVLRAPAAATRRAS